MGTLPNAIKKAVSWWVRSCSRPAKVVRIRSKTAKVKVKWAGASFDPLPAPMLPFAEDCPSVHSILYPLSHQKDHGTQRTTDHRPHPRRRRHHPPPGAAHDHGTGMDRESGNSQTAPGLLARDRRTRPAPVATDYRPTGHREDDPGDGGGTRAQAGPLDRKSTRLNSSHQK